MKKPFHAQNPPNRSFIAIGLATICHRWEGNPPKNLQKLAPKGAQKPIGGTVTGAVYTYTQAIQRISPHNGRGSLLLA